MVSASIAVGCSSKADDESSDTQAITAQPLSYVGEAVVSALDAKHPGMKGRAWNVSRDNAAKGDFVVQTPPKSTFGQNEIIAAARCTSGDDCDVDFGLVRCGSDHDCSGGAHCAPLAATTKHRGAQAESLCLGDADAILDEVWNGIAQAKQTIDVSSLSPPDGRYEAAVRNAITYLSEADSPPRVRLLFGDIVGSGTSAKKTLASLSRDVDPGSPLDMTVAVYRDGFTSWNHSKIISRDGNFLITGGANMWDVPYLGIDPVHDLWIKLQGSAAGDAVRFLDELWAFSCAPAGFTDTRDVASRLNAGCPAPFGQGPRVAAAGGVPVIAVGRLGAIGEEPSDDAIVAMIDASKESVRISQQDIGPINKLDIGEVVGSWPEPIIGALVTAMDRGVDVSLTLSNTGAVPGSVNALQAFFDGYDNGWTPAQVANEFLKYAKAHPETHRNHDDVVGLLCEKFTLMRLRSSGSDTWKDGHTLANHVKAFVVDNRAFYVGSQNFYVANLAEFGTIVDDPAAAKQFNTSYMDPIEKWSAHTAVTGKNAASCVLAQ